jgi:capsular exopolysaccharide synthesis family protein
MVIQQETAAPLGPRDYLRIVRRRRGIVVLGVVAVFVPVLLLSLVQTPRYAGAAEVLIQDRSSETLFDPNSGVRSDPARQIQNELHIIESPPVRAAVRTKLGPVPKVSATPIGQTDLIQVVATSTDPARAAAVANAYADAYIAYRREQAVSDLLAASEQVQGKITELQKQIDVAPPAQKDELLQAQSLFKQKLDQLQVDSALKQGGAQLVTPATRPTSPVSPRPVRSGILALVVGLLLGVCLAFLLDYLDDSIKTKDDFERVAPGLPVLGMIPSVSGWKAKDRPFLVSAVEPMSPAAEAYRTLRTSVQFLGLDHPMRTLQLTSANPREGKTTTLSNMAVALAGAGQRVLVVCCDLRRPRIHEFFGLSNDIGFTSALLGRVPLAEAIQHVPGHRGIDLLASGPLPPNPSELLSSNRTGEVLAALRTEYDVVLIDSPPVLPVTDALVLSRRVDATLLVSVAGTTSRKEVARATELLWQVDAPLVGAVLNGVDPEGSDGYAYQYYRDDKSRSSSTELSGNGAGTGAPGPGGEMPRPRPQPARNE